MPRMNIQDTLTYAENALRERPVKDWTHLYEDETGKEVSPANPDTVRVCFLGALLLANEVGGSFEAHNLVANRLRDVYDEQTFSGPLKRHGSEWCADVIAECREALPAVS